MKRVLLPDGCAVPALGLGTWMIGEQTGRRASEIAALQRGIDLGMSLVDTAEMYGDGASEELVGEAIRGRRDEVFLVSKVYPHNAGGRALQAACEASLRRLGVDCLDLYLLHWRGNVPFADTVAGFERLQAAGKIRRWGVSNLDTDDMAELTAIAGGEKCAINQVLYNPTRRGVEWDLLPWCREHGIPVMAYSPLEQARLLRQPKFRELAAGLGVTPAQLALAWLLRRDDIIAIPKASDPERVQENHQAASLDLDAETLAAIDRLYPPPRGPRPLDML